MGANLHQFLPTILNFLVIHPYFLTFVIFFPHFRSYSSFGSKPQECRGMAPHALKGQKQGWSSTPFQGVWGLPSKLLYI